MNKQDFLAQLRKGFSGLPQADIEERLTFYSEMIEDQMEEGLSEEEAVSAVGSVEEIVAQVKADIAPAKIAKEKTPSKRRLNAGVIVLLALGAPIWLSLGIAVLAVILSLYASLWAVIISLWAVFASLSACSIGGVLACIIFIAGANGPSGIAMLAGGILCAGLSIFMFFGCKGATKSTLLLTRKIAIWVCHCFNRKEKAQ